MILTNFFTIGSLFIFFVTEILMRNISNKDIEIKYYIDYPVDFENLGLRAWHRFLKSKILLSYFLYKFQRDFSK